MTSPERPQHERFKILEQGRWEEAIEHFRGRAAIAEKLRLGIKINFILRDAADPRRHSLEKRADEPIYGASLLKEFIAGKAIEAELPLDEEVEWAESRRDHTGSGYFDQQGAPTSAPMGVLLEDMLARSGNTATRVIVPHLGGAKGINDYLIRHGYDTTEVFDAGNQAVIFGDTTAYEALRMMRKLYETPDTEAARVVRRSLERNELSHAGVRRLTKLKADAPYIVANKTGDYAGDGPNDEDDPHPVPYSVSHDVGFVQTAEGQRLEYAILARAPRYNDGSKKGRAAHWLAEQTVSHMSAEVASTLLGRKILKLGALALR